jgi:hypothetical protein
MRVVTGVRAALCMATAAAASFQAARAPSPRHGLYDANPSHVWNRIHEHFHVRVARDGTAYGFDTVDPLLWRETRYLLSDPSNTRALRLLDEFLSTGGERLVADPLKRAVFQHDLWAIFDWLAATSDGDRPARAALMQRIARVIRRVALTKAQIDALPDTYAAAVASGAFTDGAGRGSRPPLPPDLFDAAGAWISVGGPTTVVPQHASELSRSAFIVLWSVPGGSAETMAYLKRLWDFPQPYVVDESFQQARDGEVRAKLNPALPAVPDGTRIALVRKMMLIDDTGAIVPSNVVQSIQLRAFFSAWPRQTFSELRMSRVDLFAGKTGGLRMIGPDDGDFVTFSSKGIDILESQSVPGPLRLRPVLDGCINCHHVDFEPATQTIRSLPQVLKPMTLVDSHHERWARWFPSTLTAVEAKRRSYDWGVLEGLWQTQPR